MMNILLWVLQVLAALLYTASGVMKVFLFDKVSKDVPSFGCVATGSLLRFLLRFPLTANQRSTPSQDGMQRFGPVPRVLPPLKLTARIHHRLGNTFVLL